MRFSISREALQKALKVVSGVVERKQQQNPILSNVFLSVAEQSLEVVATDQEVELRATVPVNKVEKEGSALISCHKLNDICRVLSDDEEVMIDCSADKSFIQAGKSKFVLSALPTEGFPSISNFLQQQSFSITRLSFIRLIEKTAFAMAEDDVRHFLNGMLLEIGVDFLKTVAADGHRLAIQTILFNRHEKQGKPEEAKILIPRKGILEILHALRESKSEQVAVLFSGSHARFVCDDLSVTTTLLGHKYPSYEKLIPKRGDKVACGEREILKEAIYRASALLTEKFKGIRLRFTNGAMKIFAYNSARDEAEEDVEIDFEGKEIELGFNARYLLDFLSVVNSNIVRMTFSDPNGSALLEEVGDGESRGCVCVLMPMRT